MVASPSGLKHYQQGLVYPFQGVPAITPHHNPRGGNGLAELGKRYR